MLDLRHISLLTMAKNKMEVDKDHPVIKNNLYELNQKKNGLIESIVKLQIDNEAILAQEYKTYALYATYERLTDISSDISVILFDLWRPNSLEEVEWYEYFYTLYNFTVGSLTDDMCTNFHILLHSSKYYDVINPPLCVVDSIYKNELEGLYGTMKVEHILVKDELQEIEKTFKERHNKRVELAKEKFIIKKKIGTLEDEIQKINIILNQLNV